MTDSFENRLGFSGDVNEVMNRTMRDYGLGDVKSTELITVGFQDYNVIVNTSEGSYLVKVFAENQEAGEPERPERYVKVMQAAINGGVNHPKLFEDSTGETLHVDKLSQLSMAVMAFIPGKTFYEASGDFQAPNDEQLKLVLAEAVKINAIDYDPPYQFDDWAIPNMRLMFDKTRNYLSDEGRGLVEKAFTHYDAIPLDKLPKTFVHGDMIKTNVIMGDDGKAYVIDFAVANTYPRIQELAVISANLLFDGKTPLRERTEKVTDMYIKAGGVLTDLEKSHVFDYALPGAAMEYMGSIWERDVNGDTTPEIDHWAELGLRGLREALGS
jgi:Ser/Thr protein kinase RdoA (MazF antagonist)